MQNTLTGFARTGTQAKELAELEVTAQLAGLSARERNRIKRMARSSKGRKELIEKFSKQVCECTFHTSSRVVRDKRRLRVRERVREPYPRTFHFSLPSECGHHG